MIKPKVEILVPILLPGILLNTIIILIMNATSQTLRQPPPTMSTFHSTGELKIRQLMYQKKNSIDQQQRAASLVRPTTSESRLQVSTHKLSRGRPSQPRILADQVPIFFERFINTQANVSSNEIPDEKTIRTQYRFRLPCIIENQENSKVNTHFLESFNQPFLLIQSYINELRENLLQLKQESDQIRSDMKNKSQSTQKEIDTYIAEFKEQSLRLKKLIRDDFVAHQTEQFRLNKQVTILNRERLQLEGEIEQTNFKIAALEMRLQGVECYDLQTEDIMLNTITTQNLRPDRSIYTFKSTIH